MQNSKSVTSTLRSCTGMGMQPRKTLEQYLSPYKTWIKPIKGVAKTDMVKTLMQNFDIKFLKCDLKVMYCVKFWTSIYNNTKHEPKTSQGLVKMWS